MPMILIFVESLSCASLARPSPETVREAGLHATGNRSMIGLSSFWKRAGLHERAELGYNHANVFVHGNVSAVPTQISKCSKTNIQNY